MPILSPASVSFKLLLFSTAVLSAAIALKLSVPAVADFAVCEVPSIYNGVVSWLRPPYLYLVINCIIITIVASSKLQSKKLDDVSPPEAMAPIMQQTTVEVSNIIQTNYAAPDFNYNGVGLSDSGAEKVPDFAFNKVDAREQMENPTASFVDDVMSNKENEFVIAKSAWNSLERKDSTEYSPSSVKPPVSARFGHRKNGRSSPEGGKTVLGVSRPKRQDTLESTWKTITEGRAIPLTRHLRKSDTWERNGHSNRQEEKTTPKTMMTKSETFNDRTNTRKEPSSPGSSGGESGKMRKEPSLSQDELNRRVEAFIKKFNEDMRLQRQESLNQYKEMIDRGSH